jgi:16S rRNA (guanine527-N7)-methyltransferase
LALRFSSVAVTFQEFADRLAGRAASAGVTVNTTVVDQLDTYFRLLARWNARINLTALPLDEPTDDTFDRLLIEPLAAGRLVADSALRWFDLGSGGGSPAIPLKILRPELRLTMVEAKERKAAFLREAARVLALKDVAVENARFEELAREIAATADLVTVRAVRADAELFATAAALLVGGGRLLWFGADPGRLAEAGGFRTVAVERLLGGPSSTVAVLQQIPRREAD